MCLTGDSGTPSAGFLLPFTHRTPQVTKTNASSKMFLANTNQIHTWFGSLNVIDNAGRKKEEFEQQECLYCSPTAFVEWL